MNTWLLSKQRAVCNKKSPPLKVLVDEAAWCRKAMRLHFNFLRTPPLIRVSPKVALNCRVCKRKLDIQCCKT